MSLNFVVKWIGPGKRMSMIVFHQVLNEMLPADDGKLLCSLRFEDEAASWAAAHRFDCDHAVIVGLGAGFHVARWLEERPFARATVVESRSALIAPFRARFPDAAARVRFVVLDDADGLYDHELLQEVFDQAPPILLFKPCFASGEAFFREVFKTLTGRSARSLRACMNYLGMAVGPADITQQERLLTVKDLGLIVDSETEGHPRASAVRALRELVL